MTPLVTDPLTARITRFAPVDISADVASLPATEREALGHIVAAARVMDGLFLEQVWAGNPALLVQLGGRPDAGRVSELLHYFLINKGPWSRLDHDEAFVPAGVRRAGQAASGQLLPGRRHQGRSRGVDSDADGRRRATRPSASSA